MANDELLKFDGPAKISGLDTRKITAKYETSRIRPLLEVSPGIRPALAAYPDPFLPVKFKDVETEEYCVVPQGTIVSFLPHRDWLPGLQNRYAEDIASILTPANGGTSVADKYTAEDETAGTPNLNVSNEIIDAVSGANAEPVTGYDGTYSRVANKPLGIVFQDVYQDIRYKYLNYQVFPGKVTILCDWVIELPLFSINSANFDNPTAEASVSTVSYNSYPMAFEDISSPLMPGDLVKSNVHGKFIPMDDTASTAGEEAQIMGYVLEIDDVWPKSLQAYTRTYPNSQMPGTDTKGIPSHMYAAGMVTSADAGASNQAAKVVRIQLTK